MCDLVWPNCADLNCRAVTSRSIAETREGTEQILLVAVQVCYVFSMGDCDLRFVV